MEMKLTPPTFPCLLAHNEHRDRVALIESDLSNARGKHKFKSNYDRYDFGEKTRCYVTLRFFENTHHRPLEMVLILIEVSSLGILVDKNRIDQISIVNTMNTMNEPDEVPFASERDDDDNKLFDIDHIFDSLQLEQTFDKKNK